MTQWMDALRAGADELGLVITSEQEECFARFLALLVERNAQVNLTAITDPTDIAVKHFVDSLSVEKVWHPLPGDRVIDIGTGAGFPGIPEAVRHPEVLVTLNDSVRKKIDFLRESAEALHLPNVTALWARAEVLGRDSRYRGAFNTVFARAVAHLGLLIEYALPLLKVGGSLLAMKGPSGTAEVTDCARVLALLGGKVGRVTPLTIRGAGERVIIEVLKVRPTPEQYPRDAAAMKKKPLFLDSGRGTS